MDRNFRHHSLNLPSSVALRKESVDRNSTRSANFRAYIVALRKESVDRNSAKTIRRDIASVALRKESVDRNSRGRDCG